MFKRLLSLISGKKTAEQVPAAPASESTSDGELIVAYDAYGREMQIPRSEWRDKVFLPSLDEKRNDAAGLYQAIINGLNDGFAADLIPAAARLVEIDDIPERSHTIQGIVLMQNGELSAAENTLRAGIAKAGETGTLLTNLAKVFAERGEEERADLTLWQAIQADPNQDNGLLWWASIQQTRGGEDAYLAALNRVAALPGSWRAQLWLARHHLQHNEVDAARALYQDVLAGGLYDESALMMVTGDLGNSGQIPLMIELVVPVYDVQRHDPMAGINLLRAWQALGNADEGEKLLERMYALGYAPLKQHLDEFTHVFQEMRQQAASGVPVEPSQMQISTLTLTQPVWHYGLNDANWLFSQKSKEAPIVGFFAWSKITEGEQHGEQQGESQREDDIGRLSRAIPLYYAEAMHYQSDYVSRFYVQVAEGAGPVLTGGELDGNDLFDIVPPEMHYFVTGAMGCSGEGEQREWHISLSLWDCTTREKKSTESVRVTPAQLGAQVLELEQRLLAQTGLHRAEPFDAFWRRPSVEAIDIYLDELAQAFTLTMVANKITPHAAIWGERSMLEWPLQMALQWSEIDTPKLMYLSGLGKAFDYRSAILHEFQGRTLELLREAENGNSPVARLAPLVWKIFGMENALRAHLDNLPKGTEGAYREWLERVGEK